MSAGIACTEGYTCDGETSMCNVNQCTSSTVASDCPIEDTCNEATAQCVVQSGCTATSDCRSNYCNSTTGDCQTCVVSEGATEVGDCPDEDADDSDMYYVCNTETGACDKTEKADEGLSGGAVAAIVICSILGVMGITALIWYCVKKDAGTPDSRAHDGHMSSSLIQ